MIRKEKKKNLMTMWYETDGYNEDFDNTDSDDGKCKDGHNVKEVEEEAKHEENKGWV